MPARGSHFTGPVRHAPKKSNSHPREWYRELPVGMNDPDYTHYFVDFLKATDYSTSDWTLSLVNTGTAAVGTTTNVNGVLTLATSGASGDLDNLQLKQDSWVLDTADGADSAGKRLWFETSVQPSNVADVDLFVGLSEIQTNVISTSQNYVGFRMTNGAATLAYQTCASNTQTSKTLAVGSGAAQSLTTSAYTKLGFVFYNGGAVDFYVNRAYILTITTNIPAAATGLAPVFEIKTNSANARNVLIDYLYIAKER